MIKIFKYEPFYRAYIRRKYGLKEVQFAMMLFMYDKRVAPSKELYDLAIANGFTPGTFAALKEKLIIRIVQKQGSKRVHYSATTLLDSIIQEYFDYIMQKKPFKLDLGNNAMLVDKPRASVYYLSKFMNKLNQEREQRLAQE